MTTEPSNHTSAFSWNVGAWFGVQLGSTIWLAILGFVLLSKDPLTGLVCIGGFAVVNIWGISLWRKRHRLSAYAGMQCLLVSITVVVAMAVITVNFRGHSQPPRAGEWVSTYLPFWVILIAPGLMMFFYVIERASRGRQI